MKRRQPLIIYYTPLLLKHPIFILEVKQKKNLIRKFETCCQDDIKDYKHTENIDHTDVTIRVEKLQGKMYGYIMHIVYSLIHIFYLLTVNLFLHAFLTIFWNIQVFVFRFFWIPSLMHWQWSKLYIEILARLYQDQVVRSLNMQLVIKKAIRRNFCT